MQGRAQFKHLRRDGSRVAIRRDPGPFKPLTKPNVCLGCFRVECSCAGRPTPEEET